MTDQIYQNIKKSTSVVNLKDLFTLARNVGIFDEERMMTIKNGQGKDIQVHVNELAFNFLQKFTKDVPMNAMHIYLSSMQAKGINEEFIKFISNKVNYDEIISKLETNDSILTNIYNWFIERGALENLTGINLDFKDKMNGFNEGLDVNINKSIRVLPSKDKEGFFIAKFKKLN